MSGVAMTAARIMAWRVLSTLATTVVAVVTARQLGPAGRGIYVLLLTGASFSLLICSLGINLAGRVHLCASSDPVDFGAYLGLSLCLTLLQTLVCAALAVSVLPLAKVHLSLDGIVVFALLGGSLLGQYLLNDAMNAYGRTAHAAAVDATGSLLQLGAVVLLVAAGSKSVNPYALTFVGGNLFQIALAFVVLRGTGQDLRPRHDAGEWRRLLRTGIPGIPFGLGQVLAFRLDRYLVATMLTPAAVGIYSVAATAPEALRVLSVAVSQPMFHRLAAGSAVVADFRRTRAASIALTATLAVATFALAPFAIHLLFGPRFEGAITPLRVLLLGEAGVTFFTLDGVALAALNRVPDAARAAGVGLLFVTVGDLVLIPSFGLAGAAWASVVGYSVMGIVSTALLRRAGTTPGVSDPRVARRRRAAPRRLDRG